MRTIKTEWRVFAIAVALILALPLHAQRTERAKKIGQQMLCVCGCNQILTGCNHIGCTYSHDMLREVDTRVARNEPDDLTLQAFVQEYGPTVLVEPPNKGFNRAAWVMPVVVPIFGLALVWLVVSRWRQRAALTPASTVPPDMLARARKEVGGDPDV
jgi:cytochrome c-type biogenesis protein CcmH/NrfF